MALHCCTHAASACALGQPGVRQTAPQAGFEKNRERREKAAMVNYSDGREHDKPAQHDPLSEGLRLEGDAFEVASQPI